MDIHTERLYIHTHINTEIYAYITTSIHEHSKHIHTYIQTHRHRGSNTPRGQNIQADIYKGRQSYKHTIHTYSQSVTHMERQT